jgi:molybdopterin molybdotransferase
VLSIREAIDQMMPAFAPVGVERVDLATALGRFLTETLRAREDAPPFDNSAMDGYAVRAADVLGASEASPVVLPVAGESRAGGAAPERLAPGRAMRIFTGAPLPEGADAIVVQEDTTAEGDRVSIRFASKRGHHVRARGEDLAEGAPMLPVGTALGPGELGLLASQRYATVSVYRRPTVAIVSTGDELRGLDDPPEPGTIVSSNAYALAAQVTLAGGIARVLPIARDTVDSQVAVLREALRSDLVVSSGGVSVGEYDVVRDAFREVGVEARFWKVSIKPGKPLTFGRAGAVPVVGLPGNPVSAMVTFEIFVRPGLRKMLGDPAPFPVPFPVELTHPHRRKPGRTELARAETRRDGDRILATLHRRQGSGALPSVARVDALVVLPADQESFAVGERLTALPFGPSRGSPTPPFP